MAERESDGDALLAMRRPAALSLSVATTGLEHADGAATAPLTTPKKKWMLRWRLQHQQQPLDKPTEPQTEPQTETEALRVATPVEQDDGVDPVGDSRSPSMGETPAAASMATQAPTASISPSAKAKDPETTRPRTPSPVKMPMPVDEAAAASAPTVERTTSESSSSMSMTSTESASDSVAPSRSPNGETTATATTASSRDVAPPTASDGTNANVASTAETAVAETRIDDDEDKRELTESERQRLARRKKRKSNWDVGDPRKHGGSLDLAALNLLSSINPPATHPASFAKFPRQRPPYRHSHSLDPTSPYHPQPPFHRSPVFGNSTAVMNGNSGHHSAHSSPPSTAGPVAARRTLQHSASLPLERTRSLTRHAPPGHNPTTPNGSYR